MKNKLWSNSQTSLFSLDNTVSSMFSLENTNYKHSIVLQLITVPAKIALYIYSLSISAILHNEKYFRHYPKAPPLPPPLRADNSLVKVQTWQICGIRSWMSLHFLVLGAEKTSYFVHMKKDKIRKI